MFVLFDKLVATYKKDPSLMPIVVMLSGIFGMLAFMMAGYSSQGLIHTAMVCTYCAMWFAVIPGNLIAFFEAAYD